MKVNLSKIGSFYKTSLGQYVFQRLSLLLPPLITSAGQKQKTCIASAGAFPYVSAMQDMKRLSLQSFNDQTSWPEQGDGYYILAERSHWPYRAEEADYVLMVHDLEFAEEPEVFLREAWRVLKGEGRLVVVFPNRSGKWARYDNTPFGLGYPYTLEQMDKLLSSAHFSIDKIDRCLFTAPAIPQSLVMGLVYNLLEKIGLYCLLQPGVYVVCASKHIYAPTRGLGATAAERAKQALFPQPATGSTRLNNYKGQ